MRDFVITLSHRPGELADVTNALSLQGVNIRSLTAVHVENHALVRIIPDDMEAARTALRSAHVRFEEEELVTLLLENRAGELTGVLAKLSDAGVNLEAIYVVGVADDLLELAFATDDFKKAKKALAID
jgi:hypothetical protein